MSLRTFARNVARNVATVQLRRVKHIAFMRAMLPHVSGPLS